MNELYELLTDEHKKQLGDELAKKIAMAINAIDIEDIKAEIKTQVLVDVESALEANYLSDQIKWDGLGELVSEVMVDTIKKAFVK
jgi:hypothetical protein